MHGNKENFGGEWALIPAPPPPPASANVIISLLLTPPLLKFETFYAKFLPLKILYYVLNR